MSIKDTKRFFEEARPEQSTPQFQSQLAVHVEEFREMLECLHKSSYADRHLSLVLSRTIQSLNLLKKAINQSQNFKPLIQNSKVDFLDSLGDQIITAVGVAHTLSMDIVSAVDRINESNESKKDSNGHYQYDSNKKIRKDLGNYKPPVLDDLV